LLRRSFPRTACRRRPVLSHKGRGGQRGCCDCSLRLLIWGVCPSPLQKYFIFHTDPNHWLIPRRPVPLEGRLAIVTDAGRDAVDVEVLLTRALKRTAKTCGPDASTLASSLRKATSAGDGGKRADLRGERAISRKPLRGDAGCFWRPRCEYSCATTHYSSHTRLRVRLAPGIPHALFGRKITCMPRAPCAARMRTRI
jgi:hypothetical protein